VIFAGDFGILGLVFSVGFALLTLFVFVVEICFWVVITYFQAFCLCLGGLFCWC